ncbi:hypothetical protein [Delftia acidovorans]|uniref:hypothetical protein n=1 Tax=Delftia acidovorans TaxID=80866 RepID=UPI00192C9D0F|nr:hypothetical protein [Delftia acidovorans]
MPDEVRNGTYIMPADSTTAVGEQQLATMGARAFSLGRDKVPVQLSNGEYKLPPEQVHAIGVQALDQMKDATHTPVGSRGFAAGPQEEAEPPLFFVDGGVVDDEQRRRNSFGDAAAAARDSSVTAVSPTPPSAPAPAMPSTSSPSNTFPGNRMQGDSGGSGMTSSQAARIAVAPAVQSKPVPVAPTALDAQAALDRGKIGAAWDTIKDVNDDAGRALADVAMLVPRGLAGAYDSAVIRPMRAAGIDAAYMSPSLVTSGVDPASMTPFTDQKRMQQPFGLPAPAAPGPAASTAVARAGSAPAAPATTATPTASPVAAAAVDSSRPSSHEYGPPNLTALAQPAATEVMPGVFRSGNSYGDSTQAATAGAAPRGLPSAQNMAAADALADRSQAESLARVTASRGFTPGFTGVIGQAPGNGNMWSRTPEQQRRDAEVSASSIVSPAQARGLAAMRRVSDMDKERVALAGHEAALQQTRMQGDAQRDVAALREQGDMGRAAMRERGDTGRAVLREQGDTTRANARNDIETGRLALDQQVRGFDIRAGKLQETLAQRYEAAKTPEARATIAQQIRDLAGKPNESPWKLQVTPATKNADGSTTEGSIYRYNGQTGQVERADGGAAYQASPYLDGQRLKGKDGKDYVVRNGRPEPI